MLETPAHYISPPKFIRFVAGLLFCVLLSIFGACKSGYQGSAQQARPGENKSARQVKTARVEETPFGETVTANGTLAADRATLIEAIVAMGRTLDIAVASAAKRSTTAATAP